MRLGDRVAGRAAIVKFCGEPNSGLAIIEDDRGVRVSVPVWLLVEVERLRLERDDARCVACGGPTCREEIGRLRASLASSRELFDRALSELHVAAKLPAHVPRETGVALILTWVAERADR